MDLGQGWFLVREQAPGPGKRARSYLYNSLKKERLPRALDTSPQGYGGDGLIVAGIFHDENGRLEDSIEIIDLFSGEPIDFSNENCATARISEGIINLTISSPARNFSRLIDRNDREIFPLPKNVHAVGRFRNGVASCSVEGAPNGESAGMIDRMGRILCRGCESVYENSCGLSRAVKKSENGGQCVGYLNTLGEEAIPCRYSEGSDFFDESALVRRTDGRVFLINTFGDEILELEHLSEYPGLLDSLWKTGVYQRGDKENCSVYNIDGEKIWETSDPKEYEALADRFTAAAP